MIENARISHSPPPDVYIEAGLSRAMSFANMALLLNGGAAVALLAATDWLLKGGPLNVFYYLSGMAFGIGAFCALTAAFLLSSLDFKKPSKRLRYWKIFGGSAYGDERKQFGASAVFVAWIGVALFVGGMLSFLTILPKNPSVQKSVSCSGNSCIACEISEKIDDTRCVIIKPVSRTDQASVR